MKATVTAILPHIMEVMMDPNSTSFDMDELNRRLSTLPREPDDRLR